MRDAQKQLKTENARVENTKENKCWRDRKWQEPPVVSFRVKGETCEKEIKKKKVGVKDDYSCRACVKCCFVR